MHLKVDHCHEGILQKNIKDTLHSSQIEKRPDSKIDEGRPVENNSPFGRTPLANIKDTVR